MSRPSAETRRKLSVADTIKQVEAHTLDQQRFVRALAEYLAGPNQVQKSIALQMGSAAGEEWARVRNASPLFGYLTVDEAFSELCGFFGVSNFVKESGKSV